jgi:superfamily I DNA and/or RNA helicase
MQRKPQTLLQSPRFGAKDDAPGPNKVKDNPSTPLPISLTLIRLETHTMRPERAGYEAHVRGEAAVAAALVSLIRECSPDDDIFVATPHRVQRQAVKEALISNKRVGRDGDLADALESLHLSPVDMPENVTVDTVERLQGSFSSFLRVRNILTLQSPVGSEAAFVICLFSLPRSSASTNANTTELSFLLERRRLNVAISRAKTLCLLVTSDDVLRPSVGVLANQASSAGYIFLRGYEERAWSTTINISLDQF